MMMKLLTTVVIGKAASSIAIDNAHNLDNSLPRNLVLFLTQTTEGESPKKRGCSNTVR
jgi:hypothetical protein